MGGMPTTGSPTTFRIWRRTCITDNKIEDGSLKAYTASENAGTIDAIDADAMLNYEHLDVTMPVEGEYKVSAKCGESTGARALVMVEKLDS